MRPVTILGAAQTRHCARRDDVNYAELAFEVVQDLLARTGWSHDRIGTVVTASSDFWDGRTISDMAVQDAVGAAGKSASKVSMDGVFALAYAAARVNSGAYNTCLVVAHGKASEGDPRAISRAALDPVYERPLGIDDWDLLGLEASSSMALDGASEEKLAEVAAASWNRAADNPCAHRRERRTADQILKSRMGAAPLREDMIAPDSDGACAILVANEETGRRHGATVELTRFSSITRPHGQGDCGELGRVWCDACAKSGIQVPARELDVVEVHDASSIQTLQWQGMAPGEAIPDSHFNPSGGAMGAQPGFATGLVRVAEVYERLARGEGRVGLAHGQTGFVGQSHGVWILRRR